MHQRKTLVRLSCISLALAAASVHGASHLPGIGVEDLVTLKGTCEGRGEAPTYTRVFPDGTSKGSFTVPKGRVLVLTDVEVTGFPGDADNHPFLTMGIFIYRAADPTTPVSVYRNSAPVNYDQTIGFSNGLAVFRDHLTGGITIGPGFTFAENASGDRAIATFGAPKPLFCDVHLRGYLAGGKPSQGASRRP